MFFMKWQGTRGKQLRPEFTRVKITKKSISRKYQKDENVKNTKASKSRKRQNILDHREYSVKRSQFGTRKCGNNVGYRGNKIIYI